MSNEKWGNIELPGFDDKKLLDPLLNVRLATKENNKTLYGGYKWIVCSPGNDMLAYYDEQNELLGKDNRAHSAIPPSVVYHYRFEHEYPAELFDKSKNYGRFAYLRDKLKHLKHDYDPTYWAQVYKTRYNWLINKPHEEWAFDNRDKMLSFLREKSNQTAFNVKLGVHHNVTKNKGNMSTNNMFWRGVLKGWSVHIVPIEEYERLKK